MSTGHGRLVWTSRGAWNARPVAGAGYAPLEASRVRGLVIHYSGALGDARDAHAECAGVVRRIQAHHMDARGFADIAYHALVCRHGAAYAGRPLWARSAAQGCAGTPRIARGNELYGAVCYLGGDRAGRADVTDAGKRTLHVVRHAFRDRWPNARDTLGHRHVCATACPGAELTAWIDAGGPYPTFRPAGPGGEHGA